MFRCFVLHVTGLELRKLQYSPVIYFSFDYVVFLGFLMVKYSGIVQKFEGLFSVLGG